jgi:hypothetical protein
MSDQLDLPRHVHRAAGAFLRVDTPAEYEAALADGWLPMPPLTIEQAAERYAFQLAAGEIVEKPAAKIEPTPEPEAVADVPKPPPPVKRPWGRKK